MRLFGGFLLVALSFQPEKLQMVLDSVVAYLSGCSMSFLRDSPFSGATGEAADGAGHGGRPSGGHPRGRPGGTASGSTGGALP